MAVQRVYFDNPEGIRLAGSLETPRHGEPRAWALFAHCFTCSKDTLAAVRIARALAAAGVGVLRFDFTGLGDSKGNFSDTDFSSNIADLVAAGHWLRREHGPATLLVGHSLGGAAAIAAAHQLDEVRAVATLGAPFEPAYVARQMGDGVDLIRQQGAAEVQLEGRPFLIRKQFLDDAESQPQSRRIRNLKRPLLVLHAPGDDVVDIDNAARIFQAARHPKSFVSLDDADHLLTRADDARYAAGLILAWADRYL